MSNNSKPEAGGKHYGGGLQPWDLQKHMTSTSNAFLDARRCDAIKYIFRVKGDANKLRDDWKKAIHCMQAAVDHLDEK